LAAAAALLAGLYCVASGWANRPLPRENLAVADHVGPIDAEMPLVREGFGNRSGTYRTQRIPLAAVGQPMMTYSPPRTLWVPDIGTARYGQALRFLVDPQARLIYEATTQGRTLLSYDDSADNLGHSARNRMLAGGGLVAFAAYQAIALARRRRRRDA
jgi:hypothetical protein